MNLTLPTLLLLTGVVAAKAKGLSGGETAHDLESKSFVKETPSLRRRLKSCVDHSDCPEHERCSSNNKCVPNYPADKARRSCMFNTDCPTKERCTRGWCELKPKFADKCSFSWQCKSDETCFNGICAFFNNGSTTLKTFCRSNSDCGWDETCYNNRCERTKDVKIIYCKFDWQCLGGDKCSSYGICEHPSCDFNSDCLSGKCNKSLHKCV